MKQVFVAATRQNDGKTLVSLGLFHALLQRYPNMGYMKPVGQQYRVINGEKIDKDAALIYHSYGLADNLKLMSPIAVPSGFTRQFIDGESESDTLVNKILSAKEHLSDGKSCMLYEGTGHAGVGSVFGLSNATVAKALNTSVILVTLGGIGRTIDEFMLNKACFDQQGVQVSGVIVNKVLPEKYDDVEPVIRRGFDRLGIPVFGVIPMKSMLSWPSVMALQKDLNATWLSDSEAGLLNCVEHFVIGDMQPHDALHVIKPNTVLIVPGNREGLILAALFDSLYDHQHRLSGIIFTNSVSPEQKVLDLIKRTNIPLLQVDEDSFSVATRINKMIFKVYDKESHKIKAAQDLVEQYVDLDAVCAIL